MTGGGQQQRFHIRYVSFVDVDGKPRPHSLINDEIEAMERNGYLVTGTVGAAFVQMAKEYDITILKLADQVLPLSKRQ